MKPYYILSIVFFVIVLTLITALVFFEPHKLPSERTYYLSKPPESLEKDLDDSRKSSPENLPEFPVIYNSGGVLEASVVFDEPSLYGRVLVYDHDNTRSLLIDDMVQGAWYGTSELPVYDYVRRISSFSKEYLSEEQTRVLVIGLGAGTLLKSWREENFKVDVVEVNPKVVEVSKEFFDLPQNLDYQIITDDGRHFLNNSSQKYDFIVLDLCDILEMNAHLWTKEFFALVERHLKEGGVFVTSLNYNPSSNPPLDCVLGTTLKSVFPYIYTRKGFYSRDKTTLEVFNFFAARESLEPKDNFMIEEWSPQGECRMITDENALQAVKWHLPVVEELREETKRLLGKEILLTP